MFRSILEKISWPINLLAKSLIKLYKIAISPLLGNRCRFYPSCSDYAKQALEHYHFFIALWLITKRLVKCQPLCKGGLDPLPDINNRLKNNGLSKD